MSGHLYILTDGTNTKIGITISLDKRMSSYKTHNPTFYTYKVYECPIEEAKKVEATIKHHFKDKLSGAAKEWFVVSAEEVDRLASALLKSNQSQSLHPAMHAVGLTGEAYETKEKLVDAFKKTGGLNDDTTRPLKERMAELLASSFKLGIPDHRLPQDIIGKDPLLVDLNCADKKSPEVIDAVKKNYVALTCGDHYYRFYTLIELNTGHSYAICTGMVSMPYLNTINGKENKIIKQANELGLNALFHHEWSWHQPNETGLIIYMSKTPIATTVDRFDKSFRKWVIERSKLLEQTVFDTDKERETYLQTIRDICRDATFPLEVKSAKELYDSYIEPFWWYAYEDNHFMQSSYERLFEMWMSSDQKINP